MSINRVEPEQKRRKDTPTGPVPRMRMRGAEFMTGDFFAGGIKRREKGGRTVASVPRSEKVTGRSVG